MSFWVRGLLSLLTVVSCVLSQPVVVYAQNANQAAKTSVDISAQELTAEIAKKLPSTLEFKFIQDLATKMNIRAWLFGGTAAAYAHYVKWNLQRQHGDTRFQADRFDYDYTNIYRSSQDLDIVIDGTAEQAAEFQKALSETFPHLQGNKTAWEVRLLTQDMGDKQALLNNPDYLNQHTDSNSTGMIELTKSNEPIIRDLRDWKTSDAYFLKDILSGQLHYYFSDKHETTSFFKQGRNPPILSAIRYLTKAFQYELKMSAEDQAKMKSVIEAFDPKAPMNSYVSHWIIKNAKKLVQNAVNIEYAINTLDQLGLRKKLTHLDDKDQVESLAWWMNKEPLRTHALGEGSGKTARELGLDILAHETNNFNAYESITRAHTGDANVLISRSTERGHGEMANFGDGFYTKAGRVGRGCAGACSNITIRFHLNPEAREGTDFIHAKPFTVGRMIYSPLDDAEYIILNKAALKVIPESLNFSLLEYFQYLLKGNISYSDRGLLEKLERRVATKINANPEEEAAILQLVRENLGNQVVTGTWLSLPISLRHPEIIDEMIQSQLTESLILSISHEPLWMNRPDLIEKLFSDESMRSRVILQFFAKPEAIKNYKTLLKMIEQGNRYNDIEIINSVLRIEGWEAHPEVVEALIKKGTADSLIALSVLSQRVWTNHPEFVQQLLDKNNPEVDATIALHIISKPYWNKHPEFLETIIDRGAWDHEIAMSILYSGQWNDHPELVEKLIRKGTVDQEIAYLLTDAKWSHHEEWIEILLKRGNVDDKTWEKILAQYHWQKSPKFQSLCKNGVVNLKNLRKGLGITAQKKPGLFAWISKSISRPSKAPLCHRIFLGE